MEHFGTGIRELKLGSTFNPGNNSRTSFHTLKYDFKPASVDLSKVATLDVGASNQVTVTVPHLDSSGVPKTVFKGNQKKYTKECVLIIDKVTGEVTLERLNQNIQVKKTRNENHKAAPLPAGAGNGPARPLENSTQRTVSRTKVSTGYKKNSIAGLGGIIQRHSPLQGSPSYPHHKSPQQAPAWNANNNQSTLPSIPLIGMDDDFLPSHNSGGASSMSSDQHSYNHQPPQQQQHQQHQQQQQHFQPQSSMGNSHHQKQPQHQNPDHYNSSSHSMMSASNAHQSSHMYQNNQMPPSAVVSSLTSSDSSSDSDSSGSSDSDDEPSTQSNHHNNGHTNHSSSSNASNPMIHQNNLMNGGLPTLLLDEDLRLSDSD